MVSGHRRRWLGILGLGASLLVLAACSSSEAFQGTELTAASPATPFELQNQFGQRVSLTDYKGEVVLLTFLYTSCPDVCPIVTSQLRDTHAMLGDDASDVAFIAVSVDPERDSVEAARAYSERWDMANSWDFLVGDKEQLSPIWQAYYVDPSPDHRPAGNGVQSIEEDGQRHSGVDTLVEDITSRYLVIHSAPVYLIDREGIMRVVFTLPFEPEAVAHDIRLLLD